MPNDGLAPTVGRSSGRPQHTRVDTASMMTHGASLVSANADR